MRNPTQGFQNCLSTLKLPEPCWDPGLGMSTRYRWGKSPYPEASHTGWMDGCGWQSAEWLGWGRRNPHLPQWPEKSSRNEQGKGKLVKKPHTKPQHRLSGPPRPCASSGSDTAMAAEATSLVPILFTSSNLCECV
jgi:hypothetical protein